MKYLAVVVLLSGCFQPVETETHLLSSCTGQCPLGVCDDDGGMQCSAYSIVTLSKAPTCTTSSGSYCGTSDGEHGIPSKFGAICSDGGVTVFDCPCAPDSGFIPAVCKTACPSTCGH